MFLVDSSGSVGRFHFETLKRFVADVVSYLDVTSGRYRVGFITFSDAAWVVFNLTSSAGVNQSELAAAIRSAPYRYGATNTADALLRMTEVAFADDVSVDQKIAVLVTDGVSNVQRRRTVAEARRARARGVVIGGVGVGLTERGELAAVVSRPAGTLHVDTFDELPPRAIDVARRICPGEQRANL